MTHLRDTTKMVRYVSNFDTSQQATDSLGQSTEVNDGKGN